MNVASAPASTSQQKTRVTGLVPPIPTPFRDGKLDIDSLKRVLDDLAGNVSGILVGGSVGETPNLTLEERISLTREVAAYIAGTDTFLAASISDNAIESSRRLSEAAGEVGADLLMVLCPNYFTNDRRMLEAYMAALSGFASADICLYDNPIASHTTLSVEDIKALAAAAPRMTHIKVTDLSLGKVEALRRETSLTIHSGDDAVLYHHLVGGADGAMVALPMIYPQRTAAIWRARSEGDLETMRREYGHVTSFIHIALGAPDYVSVIKTVLHHRGVIASPEVRLPLLPLAKARATQAIEAYEL